MTDFKPGDRVVFKREGYPECPGVFIRERINGQGVAFIGMMPDTWVFGKATFYTFHKRDIKYIGPALTPQERVLKRIQELDQRYKDHMMKKKGSQDGKVQCG